MEWELDGQYMRFALCSLLPFLFCVSLVRFSKFNLLYELPMIVTPVISSSHCRLSNRSPWRTLQCLLFPLNSTHWLFNSIGPIAQYHENSKYYSAHKPKANKVVDKQSPACDNSNACVQGVPRDCLVSIRNSPFSVPRAELICSN